MVFMALEDYIELCETITHPMKHDELFETHAAIMHAGCLAYEGIAWATQRRIDHLAPHSDIFIRATLYVEHLSRTPRHFPNINPESRVTYQTHIDTIVDGYYREGHAGIVTVLLMQQFLRFGVTDDRLPLFFECRRCFMLDVATFISSDVVDGLVSQEHIELFDESQLFMPKTLLRHPDILQDYEAVGLKDCLGRSVPLRKYDAGIVKGIETTCHDPYDCIGRTILLAACTRDDSRVVDVLISRRLVCATEATKTESGLSPLHIAAMRAPLAFSRLYLYYIELGCLFTVIAENDASNRTLLEWAASCGQHEIFLFLSVHGLSLSNTTVMKLLELSLRYDHGRIVQTLVRWTGVVPFRDSDDQGRTPRWYAAHYQRFPIWCSFILESTQHNLTGFMVCDNEGRTPLMEAARVGFYQGLEYMLARALCDNPWLRDNTGNTAFELAQNNGHDHCARLLLDRGG